MGEVTSISLLPTVYTINMDTYMLISTGYIRISKKATNQAGFRRGRIILDQIFILKDARKHRERTDDIHALFFEFKAHDSVERKYFWRIMTELGTSGKLMRLTMTCTNDTKCWFLIEGYRDVSCTPEWNIKSLKWYSFHWKRPRGHEEIRQDSYNRNIALAYK